jgi:outer membrane protein OmpA-like peptidoglycan-associated protein
MVLLTSGVNVKSSNILKSFISIRICIAITLFFLFTGGVQAQGLFDKIKEKVKEKVEQKTDEAIDESVDAAAESVDDAVKSDENNNAEENQKVEPEKQKKALKEEVSGEEPADEQAVQEKASLKSFSKYDFVPGEKVIYFEDFASDNVGDFPALWNTDKSGEVTTTNLYPGKWFQMKEYGMFWWEKPISLPKNFTLEFDIIPLNNGEEQQSLGLDLTLLQTEGDDIYPNMYVPGKGGVVLDLLTPNGSHSLSGYKTGAKGIDGYYNKPNGLLIAKELNHVSIWVQQTRIRVYIHGEKVFDFPKAIDASLSLDQLRLWSHEGSEPMISNIRIAEAGADMRSKLMTEGKLVVHGIYFDSGSDKIKPESAGTLKEIANVLKENSGVKVKIVGHTDSDGDDKKNMDLSKRRAASVKKSLAEEYGIDASRMVTDGKGESAPISDNKTPEGKANNRRVEFVKL